MQRYNLELIEYRWWRVAIEAESETEAIARIKREQRAEEAYSIGTRLEIVSCNREENKTQ